MFYTIVEIAVYLVIAALLGFWLGFLFRGRRDEAELAAVRRTAKAREKELLGVWQRKVADCERQCEALRATAEQGATEKAAPAEVAAKQTTGNRAEPERREPKPVGESAQKPAAEPARKPAKEQTKKPAEMVANDKSDDEAAKQRVKTLVERASGELADSEQPDRETARKQVKAMVQRMSGEKKPPHDNLKKIYGIGPKFEKVLNELGITSYQQIARFSVDDIKTVAAAIEAFPDRVERDNWIEGAIKAHRKKYGKAPDSSGD